jgi:hypothetical protein
MLPSIALWWVWRWLSLWISSDVGVSVVVIYKKKELAGLWGKGGKKQDGVGVCVCTFSFPRVSHPDYYLFHMYGEYWPMSEGYE